MSRTVVSCKLKTYVDTIWSNIDLFIFKLETCFQEDCHPLRRLVEFMNSKISSKYSDIVTNLTNSLLNISNIIKCEHYHATHQSVDETFSNNYYRGKHINRFISALAKRYSTCS